MLDSNKVRPELHRGITWATVVAFPFYVASLAGQILAPPSPQPPIFTSRTNLVLVPALVTTHKGELVYSLTASDFTITDDGAPQTATLDQDTGGEPLALVVAIQTGGAGARHLADYRNLPAMIEALIGNVEHRVAVVSFDNAPALVQDFSPDLDRLKPALDGLNPRSNGAALLDALGYSVELLRRQPAGYRRAILLIGETIDRGSKATLAEALRAVSDTNTAIYSMAFSTSKADLKSQAGELNNNTPGPPGGCMSRNAGAKVHKDPYGTPDPDDDDPLPQPGTGRWKQAWDCLTLLAPPLRVARMAALLGMDGLRQNAPETVAHLTGGEYYRFDNAHSLERSLLTLANHLPNRYVLSFHPESPHPGLHAIEIKLRDYPNLTVVGRTSYWADADAGSKTRPQP